MITIEENSETNT